LYFGDHSLLSENFDPSTFVPNIQTETLLEYSRKIQFLKDLRNSEKVVLGINESQKRNRINRNVHMTHAEKNTELDVLAKVKNAAIQELRKLIIIDPSTPDKNKESRPVQKPKNKDSQNQNEQYNPTSVTTAHKTTLQTSNPANRGTFLAVEKLLAKDADEREKITADMEKLAKGIKENYQQAHNRISSDNANIEKLPTVISTNLNQTNQHIDSLGGMIQSNTKTTLIYYLLMLIAVMAFFGMYIYIKMFYK